MCIIGPYAAKLGRKIHLAHRDRIARRDGPRADATRLSNYA
jgi:hypothetical protein